MPGSAASMAIQALCTPVTQKHRNDSMQLANIYYYTYLMDNFSQVARKMCLMGFFQAGMARASLAPTCRELQTWGDEDE
jgi:hypothetical protein